MTQQSKLPLSDYQYLKGLQKYGKTVLHETSKFGTLVKLIKAGFITKDLGRLHRNLQGDPRARDPESLIGQYILTEAGEAELRKEPPPSDEVVRLLATVDELERLVLYLADGGSLDALGLTERVAEIRARQKIGS